MTELICPECQYANDADAVYCEECGILLSDQPEQDTKSTEDRFYIQGDIIDGRYEILSVLCSNYFEVSYLALDQLENDRMVWIKQKSTDIDSGIDPDELEKLYNLLKKNPNKHLVRLWDVFRKDNFIFLVFENLEGENLQTVMDLGRKAINQDIVVEWAIQASKGLKFLHSLGILHRDIQPSHLFLTEDGIVKITGYSRICCVDHVCEDNAVTEGFSPPEAYGLMGGKISRQSDIFSLGATIYSFIVGKSPKFSRENFFNFTFITESDLKVDPALEYIVLKAVKKEPPERFENIGDMLDKLIKVKQKSFSREKEKDKDERMELEYETISRSHVGRVRSINQDSCLVMDLSAMEKSIPKNFKLLVVADGMGGEAEGDKASSMAVRVIAQEVLRNFLPVQATGDTAKLYNHEDLQSHSADILRQALHKANKTVFDYSREDVSRKGMGSTISAAIIRQNNVCVCHAGDTRAYVFNRRTGIIQITEDHSLVGRLVRMGQMTREEALRSPQRSAVYRALGTTPELEVDVYQYTMRNGDFLLICSDGVWEYYTDQELTGIFMEEGTPEKILDRLIRTCLERGADDNATAIISYAEFKDSEMYLKTQAVSHPDKLRIFVPESGEAVKMEDKPSELKIKEIKPQKESSEKRIREELEKQRLAESPDKSAEDEEPVDSLLELPAPPEDEELLIEAREEKVQALRLPVIIKESSTKLPEPDTGELPPLKKRKKSGDALPALVPSEPVFDGVEDAEPDTDELVPHAIESKLEEDLSKDTHEMDEVESPQESIPSGEDEVIPVVKEDDQVDTDELGDKKKVKSAGGSKKKKKRRKKSR
jgi:PPM family protein phosphatase